jgi:hypothetical protein
VRKHVLTLGLPVNARGTTGVTTYDVSKPSGRLIQSHVAV